MYAPPAVSPASVWRVLHRAGRLARWNRKPSSKGQGFQPPPGPHQHWHVDISYLNLGGTFYYSRRPPFLYAPVSFFK